MIITESNVCIGHLFHICKYTHIVISMRKFNSLNKRPCPPNNFHKIPCPSTWTNANISTSTVAAR